MKKMKKMLPAITIGVILIAGMLLMSGCKTKNEEKTEVKKDTVATKLVTAFEKEIKNEKDIENVANTISTNENIEIGVIVVEAEQGFLDGFKDEVTGFSKGYAIKPMIGGQPFVAYVFETDDVDSLKDELKEKADKKWNICTQADELEMTSVDNYVFFVMSPTSFDE